MYNCSVLIESSNVTKPVQFTIYCWGSLGAAFLKCCINSLYYVARAV